MYRGKRRGRRGGKRSKGDPMRFLSRGTSVAGKVKRKFAKALSSKKYDQAVFRSTGHFSAGTSYFNATNMSPISDCLGLSDALSGNTSALTAYDLAKTFPIKFQRYLNFYTQFRIKYIRFEFTPASAVYPVVNANGYVAADSAIPTQTVNIYPSARDEVMMVAWPPKGTLQYANNTSIGGVGGTLFGGDPSQPPANLVAKNLEIVKKLPLMKTISFAWKPRVIGYKTNLFTPSNGLIAGGNAQPSVQSTTIAYPWTNIMDNQYTQAVPASLATFNTTGLRQAMTQPYLGLYDLGNDTFPTQFGNTTTGRWELSAVFEFRGKRGDAASFGAYSETIQNVSIPLVV